MDSLSSVHDTCWDASQILFLRPRELFGSILSTGVAAVVAVRHSLIIRLVAACRRVGQFRPRLLLWSIMSSQIATGILEVFGQEGVLGLFRPGLTRVP